MTPRDNPFPGMDPWMEATWSDVHLKLIAYIGDAVSEALPPDLRVRSEQQVSIGNEGERRRPDVAVLESWKQGIPPQWQPTVEGGAVMTAEPEIVMVDDETLRWIEIRDRSGLLVTVIEVLSPTNKGWDQANYLARQNTYLHSRVNLVEIDLLRAGRHTVALPAENVREPGESARYLACVVRDAQPTSREVYYMPLRERLRAIRIPLRVTDADVVLDLQPLVDRCYRTGAYWQTDYSRPPAPPLGEADAAWARELLQAAGRL